MSVSQDCLVVGAGFRGLIAAYELRRAGHRATIVDRAPFIGGVMYSMEHEGLFLDNGCHLFDNASDESSQLIHELFGGTVLPVDVRYASWTTDRRVDGIAIPDYATIGRSDIDRALFELIEATALDKDTDTLADLILSRYGATIGNRLRASVEKILQFDASNLAPEAFHCLPCKRVALLPAEMMEFLKRHPDLDPVLAVSSQDDPMRFVRHSATKYPYRNYYPAERGLRGFCESAYRVLVEKGVDFHLRCAVESMSVAGQRMKVDFTDGVVREFDAVFWGSALSGLGDVFEVGEPGLDDLLHHVPCIVVHFLVPPDEVENLTYLHDFRPDTRVYRGSTPGVYGRQTNAAGMTYVTLEIPASHDQDLWQDTESHIDAIWQETRALGLVNARRHDGYKVIHAKITYSVPKKGYSQRVEEAVQQVTNRFNKLLIPDFTIFSKEDIVRQTCQQLNDRGMT